MKKKKFTILENGQKKEIEVNADEVAINETNGGGAALTNTRTGEKKVLAETYEEAIKKLLK